MRYETDSFFLLVSKKQKTRYIDVSAYRVEIAVSSKLVKTAVKRNRIKRLIKEVIRIIKQEGVAAEGKNIIIGVKKDISAENYKFFSKEILDLFNKAKLLN